MIEGTGDIANMGTVVSCSFEVYLLHDLTSGAVEKLNFEQFKIGEGDAVPGLEFLHPVENT